MRERPTRGLCQFLIGWMQRGQVADGIAASINGRIQLEMDLVDPVDEVYDEMGAILMSPALCPILKLCQAI